MIQDLLNEANEIEHFLRLLLHNYEFNRIRTIDHVNLVECEILIDQLPDHIRRRLWKAIRQTLAHHCDTLRSQATGAQMLLEQAKRERAKEQQQPRRLYVAAINPNVPHI